MASDDEGTAIEGLAMKIRSCRTCVDAPTGAPLPHEPNPVCVLSSTARICIAGQAPGTRVHASGRPFTDPSGDRLRAWMGVSHETFYDASRIAIVPMGFCFPGLDAKGGDLPPRRECAHKWHVDVFAGMRKIELILVVGQYAQAWHMKEQRKSTLTETVRHWRDYQNEKGGRCVLPLPHPSWRNTMWLKKNPWFEADVVPYLRKKIAYLLDN